MSDLDDYGVTATCRYCGTVTNQHPVNGWLRCPACLRRWKPWLTVTGRSPAARRVRYLDDTVWFDQLGHKWEVHEMATSHLENTARLILSTPMSYASSVVNKEMWELAAIEDQGVDTEYDDDELHQLYWRAVRTARKLGAVMEGDLDEYERLRRKLARREQKLKDYVGSRPLVRAMFAEIGKRKAFNDPGPGVVMPVVPEPVEFDDLTGEAVFPPFADLDG